MYNKAKDEVTKNGKFKDKYIPIYEKMRDIGIDSFQVEDMDVSFISTLIHGCKSIVPTESQTRKSMEQLIEVHICLK